MSEMLRKRIRWYVVAGSLLIPLTAVLASIASDATLPCQQRKAWVDAHSGNLPHEAQELAAFPAPYRRLIVARLPAETRSSVWKEHLTRVLSEPLSAPQRMLILEALTMTDQDFFGSPNAADRSARFEERARRAYPSSDYRRIFVDMGRRGGSYRSLASAKILLREKVKRALTPTAVAFQIGCECRFSSDCDANDCLNFEACDPQPGCGPFGTSTCVRLCGPA